MINYSLQFSFGNSINKKIIIFSNIKFHFTLKLKFNFKIKVKDLNDLNDLKDLNELVSIDDEKK